MCMIKVEKSDKPKKTDQKHKNTEYSVNYLQKRGWKALILLGI